jgi:hypothetical protein
MKPLVKNSLALTLAGVMTLAAVSPTFARSWRYGAAAGAGFVAGAAVGAAAANAAVYGPAYQAYAYAPGQIPGNLGYGYQSDGSDGLSGCAVAGNYGGKTDYGAC